MRVSWSIVLCVAFGGRPSPPPTVALVSDMAVEAHHDAADAFAEISDARVVRVGPSQPWPDAARPDVVVAVGDAADAAAARRWPDTPRASLSMVGDAPAPAALPQDGPARFWSSAHTEPTCTAAQLRAVSSAGDWIVVASPTDDDAKLLSEALRAELVRGTPAEIARTLRDRARPGGHIWIRGAASMAIPEWLAFLGRMSRLGGPRIGFDLPAGARWGLARWVRPDHVGVARSADAWIDRVTAPRRSAPPTLTLETAPCRRTSSDPHHD